MAGRVFVIVGASLAGAKAAQGLREAGFDGRVVLIGEEPALPYARPELSKGYLLGGKTMADMLVHPAGVLCRARHRGADRHDGDRDRPGHQPGAARRR